MEYRLCTSDSEGTISNENLIKILHQFVRGRFFFMSKTYKGSIPSVTPRIASNFGKR